MNWRRIFSPACITALLTMSAGAAVMTTAIDAMHIVLQKKPIYAENRRAVRAIPTETEHWTRIGKDVDELPAVVEELGTENYVTRTYLEKLPAGAKGKPRVVQLHAAYYTGTIDTVPHVPDRCFVGAGWSIVGGPWVRDVPLSTANWVPAADLPPSLHGKVYTTRLSQEYSTAGRGRRINLPTGLAPGNPPHLRITEFMDPEGHHRFEGYFFIANSTCVSSAEDVRGAAFDLTAEYAYYMKVQVGSSDVTTAEELASAAASLLDDLFGELVACTPDWVRVVQGQWPPGGDAVSKPVGGDSRR
jgi:hypothetical protein